MGTPKWAVGMQRLMPGIYVDEDHGMHFDLVELCEAAGCAPTVVNQMRLEQTARQVIAAAFPEVEPQVIDEGAKHGGGES